MSSIESLIRLVERLREPQPLATLMQAIADGTAETLGTHRASVRMLDPSRTSLIAVARAGEPLHDRPVEFAVGEGLLGWIVEHGEIVRTADAERDPRFAVRSGLAGRMGAFLGAPLFTGAECSGVISVVDSAPDAEFSIEQERLLALIAALCAPYLEIARLSRLSRVDPLTGALNRRGLDLDFPEIATEADGLVVPLSVVMVDVDHFKRINDRHGHATGDLALRQLATVLAAALRGGDAVIRYGGEEFLLVLPKADLEQAIRVAERIRATVATMAIEVGELRLAITISVGVAERRPGEARDALIARADSALYRAKELGRDRVEIAG